MNQQLEAAERERRRDAILAMAGRHMKRLDEYDLEALCSLADADNLTLAEMVMNPALWPAGSVR